MTNEEAREIMSKVTFYWELGEQTLTQNQINEALDLAIKALEQQPKIGKWIVYPKGIGAHLVCNKCLSNAPYDCKTNYCPKCGAKME